MLSVILTLMLARYEMVLHSSLQALTRADRDVTKRFFALDAISRVRGLSDPRLVSFFKSSKHAHWSDFCDERFFDPALFGLFIDSIKSETGRYSPMTHLEKMYNVRRKWWGNHDNQAIIDKAILSYYHEVAEKEVSQLENKRDGGNNIALWLDMCRCYAYAGNRKIIPMCEKALQDKRYLREQGRWSSPVPPLPPMVEERICDHALVSLLILYQADVTEILKDTDEYERVQRAYMSRDTRLMSFVKLRDAMLDKVIADYQKIKKKHNK